MHPSFEPITSFLTHLFLHLYILGQRVVRWLFAPQRPRSGMQQKNGKIAVIGAGISGISAAAHAVSHGWDVTIFEAKKDVGGIWAEVNRTSGLQIHSSLYRFFPDLVWSSGYPQQEEIVGNIKRIWAENHLQNRTRFDTPVTSIEREGKKNDNDCSSPSVWYINGDKENPFDAVVVAIGTCGAPRLAEFKNQDKFKGTVVHSSKLDDLDVAGKRVLVVGGGASAIEAAELSIHKGAASTDMLTRSDKWIIPRNILFEAALSMYPGYQIFLSKIPEWYLRKFFYRELKDFAPKFGIHTSTPVVNSEFLEHMRNGNVTLRRGDVVEVTENGIRFDQHDSSADVMAKHLGVDAPKAIAARAKQTGGSGNQDLSADIIIMATGFESPIGTQTFIPDRYTEDPFAPPNIYMQVFSVRDSSLLLLNCTFKNAVATAGHIHLGMYTRLLLTFLADPTCAPYPELMQVWVRFINLWKTSDAKAVTALTFITYFELLLWFAMFFIVNPFRLRYLTFILFGWHSESLQKSAQTRGKIYKKLRKEGK